MIQQGLTPPVSPPDPETKVRKISRKGVLQRRQVSLSADQEKSVKELLGKIWEDWTTNTSLLKSKLLRYNNIMEGVKEPKTFPWIGCSNLHIPLIEIHITILHSVASSTMLEMEPIYYIKPLMDGVGEEVDTDIEKFLHAKCKLEIKVDQVLSDIFWNTYRDGLGIGVLDWVEDYGKQYDAKEFATAEEFTAVFPTPKDAGLSDKEYQDMIATIADDGGACFLVEEVLATYCGPRVRIVELKDLIVWPMTSPDFDYSKFVGDAFVERRDYYKRMAKNDEWFTKTEVEAILGSPLDAAPDVISQSQDQIEGIGRNNTADRDEYLSMQGLLRYDLDNDGIEEKFLIVFHPKTKALLRFERFPYWHNRCNWIPWRFKKRPKRLLGQSVPDQLIDLNDEVDTQHNQRVDTRTITTVPSFLKLDTSDWDPTRKDQKFFPGVTFKVSNFNQFKQMEIRQTDMGESMKEEQNLMLIADTRTGASQLRSGRESTGDPRSPAKKVALLMQASNQRIDDHMRELRYGTEELGYQILELYYQYAPDTIPYPKFHPETQQYVMAQVARAKLRNRSMLIQVARTSVLDNPSQVVQRLMTVYAIVSRDPLVAGNIMRRRELLFRLLTALRERDPEKIVPKAAQLIEEMQQQSGSDGIQQMMGALFGNAPKSPRQESGATRTMDTSGGSAIAE